MGDNFTPPKIEKRNNTVENQQVAETETTTEQMGRIVNGPQDIYKNGIDDFVSFLKGEIGGGTVEERQNNQKSFLKTVWGMLELDYPQAKECLDYLLIKVKEEQNIFEWSKVLAPLRSLEGIVSATEIARYKRFMTFITLLSEHVRDRTTFTKMFDMTKFESQFSEKARTNLHTYVYR